MALKTFKPTSPGLRQVVLIDRSDLWKGDPVKSLTEGHKFTGGRKQPRPHHDASSRRRFIAALPHHRFQAPQVRRRRHGRAHRVRSEPHRLHRAGALSDGELNYIWRRSA